MRHGHRELGYNRNDLKTLLLLLQGPLVASIGVAVMVWGARLIGIYSGSWIGAWLGGAPSDIRRRVWQGMITQVRTWLLCVLWRS